jgi:hypothetical protein
MQCTTVTSHCNNYVNLLPFIRIMQYETQDNCQSIAASMSRMPHAVTNPLPFAPINTPSLPASSPTKYTYTQSDLGAIYVYITTCPCTKSISGRNFSNFVVCACIRDKNKFDSQVLKSIFYLPMQLNMTHHWFSRH